MTQPIFDIKSVEKALIEAARVAREGTREQQAGKFLGPQPAVENAVANLHRRRSASRD